MPTLNDVTRAMQNAQELGDKERLARLTQMYNREYARLYGTPKKKEEESGFLENIATGFGAGYVGTLESAALGAATLQEEEAELRSRQKIKSIADSFTPEGGDKDSIAYKLASGIGSIGAFATAAPLGKAALPIAGVLGIASGAGESSERARAYGATEEERNIAVRKGAAIGATEVLPLGLVAKTLKIPGLPKAIDKLSSKVTPATVTGIKSRLQRAAITGVKEGAQEAAAAVLQNLTEQGYNPEQVLFEAGVVEEGAIGGGAGAILQGLVDLFGGKKRVRSVEDDGGTAEETTTETPVETKEETKEEPKQKAKETPVPAEPATPVEKKKEPKPSAGVETRISAFLDRLDTDKLEGIAADTARLEKDAKNAGLPVGTYELMVKNAISKKKEAADVGEQVTGTPDTKTTGESVPSGTGVVGDERADGTKKPRGTVEGRLDDSVGDTGRPTGREGEPDTTVEPIKEALPVNKESELAKGKKTKLRTKRQRLRQARRAKDLIAKEKAALEQESEVKVVAEEDVKEPSITDIPTYDAKTKKLSFKSTKKLIGSHGAIKDDVARLDSLVNKGVINPKKPNTEEKKLKSIPEKKRTQAQKDRLALLTAERETTNKTNAAGEKVIRYLNNFKTPMDGLYAAVYEVADPKSTAVYELAEGAKAEDPLQEYTVGTGGENAQIVIDWAQNNLSKETNRQLREKRRSFAKEARDLKKRMDALKEPPKEAGTTQKAASKQVKRMIDRQRAAGPVTIIKDGKRTKVEAGKVKDIDETKLSKEDKAKLSADENFANFIKRPRTDLRKVNDFEKAREYAEKSTDPEGNLDTLKVLRAKAFNNEGQATRAAKRVDERKEAGVVKQRTEKAKAIDTALERLNNEKVTIAGLELMRKDLGIKYLKKATLEEAISYSESAAEAQAQGYGSMYSSDAEVVLAITKNVSAKTKKLLEQGDLKAALLEISKTVENKRMKSIARAFADNIGTTSVSFDTDAGIKSRMSPKYASDNTITHGVFFHGSNSIVLNKNVPISIHLVMHESTHATMDIAYHNKKNSVPAKQLRKLFKELKPFLDPNAEGQNIREFIAESQSNPIFRRRLGQIKDAEGISAWQKLVNIVKNFINMMTGRGTVPVNSKLSVVDDAVMALMNPTPENFTNSYNLEPSQMAKGIDEALRPIREEVKSTSSFKDFWKNLTAGQAGLKGLAMGVHLHTLGDLARATGFGNLVTELHEVINNQAGNMSKAVEKVDKAVQDKKARAKRLSPKALQAYEDLIYHMDYGATLYDVNPFAGSLQYKGKFDYDQNDLYEIYGKQQDVLNGLKPEEVKELEAQYNAEKKLNKDQFGGVVRALQTESRKVAESGDASAVKQLDGIIKTLLSRATIEEYWPLTRPDGKFAVSYIYEVTDDKTGAIIREEPGFEIFKNVSERDALIDKLKELPNAKSVKPILMDDNFSYIDNAPSGTFVSQVLEILAGAGVDPVVQEQIIQQYVNALPASSVYRSLVRRGNVAGFVGDTLTALETKTKSMAAQSAKIESVADIATKVREIRDRYEEIKKDDSIDVAKAKAIMDVAIGKHARFAMSGAVNKPMEALYKELNQMAFLYTLGFNVSSAAVNLSQIPLVAVPYLAARYGLGNTIDSFTQAGSVIKGSKISLIEYYDSDYNLKSSVKKDIEQNSIDKEDAKARIEYLESIIPMVKEAHSQGKLYSSRTLVELGLGEKANARDKLAHLSAFFFNGGERFNTQTTILASYDLIRNKMFKDRQAGKKFFSVRQGKEIDVPTDVGQLRAIAAKEAIYTTQEVNGGARLETTAPVAKEGIGRVALMYKSYGLMMNSSMIKSGLAAANVLYKDNPEQRRIAIKQLAGIHLSALLFAGLGGVPIWGLISMVWDLFLDDEEDDADTILRKHIGEMGFKGPLSTLTGVDVSSRIKLNDLIFQENRFMRDPSLEENIGYYLGGPALSTGKRLMRSIKDFSEAEYYRAAESAAPAGFGNALQAGRYFMDNGVKTRGGQFIYENIGAGEIAAKAFGFAPLEYSFRTAQSAAEGKISNAIMERRRKLNKLYFRALQDRDLSTARDVYEDIKEFNKRHPEAAITEDTIKRSIKSQLDKIATMHNGVPVNQMLQLAMEKSRLEYKKWDE